MRGHRVPMIAAALAAAAPSQPTAPVVEPPRPLPICTPPTVLPPQNSRAAHSTPYTDRRPPDRFASGRACVRVQFETPDDVQRLCVAGGTASPPPGMSIIACYLDDRADGLKIVMPNPCGYPDADAYAHLLCHETGHVNGWPVTHGD